MIFLKCSLVTGISLAHPCCRLPSIQSARPGGPGWAAEARDKRSRFLAFEFQKSVSSEQEGFITKLNILETEEAERAPSPPANRMIPWPSGGEESLGEEMRLGSFKSLERGPVPTPPQRAAEGWGGGWGWGNWLKLCFCLS